jgi:uncharacterized protein YjbI with pentapeptide repeats
MSNDRKIRSELHNARVAADEAKKTQNLLNSLLRRAAPPKPPAGLPNVDPPEGFVMPELGGIQQDGQREIVLPKSARGLALDAAVQLLAPIVTHTPPPRPGLFVGGDATPAHNPYALQTRSDAFLVAGNSHAVAYVPADTSLAAASRDDSKAVSSKDSSKILPRKEKVKSARSLVPSAVRELRIVTANEFQAAVEQKRKETPAGEIVDLSDLADLQIQGVLTDFGYPGSFPDMRDVISGLDVSGTNFPQVFNMDDLYFRDSNFSGCRFGNTTDLTLDGCDLSGADMSNTTQTRLVLGDDVGFIGRSISAMDRETLHHATPGSAEYLRAQSAIAQLQARLDGLRPTSFRNVKLDGATLFDVTDNYLVDYAGTSFARVKIVNYNGFGGQNLDLSGATYQPRTPMGPAFGDEFTITAPIGAETVVAQAGDFVGSMLRGNLINPLNDGTVTTIAIAGSAVNGSFADVLARCNEVFGNGLRHEPVALSDAQNLTLILNQHYARHNARFVVDDGLQPFDYRLTFCQSSVAVDTGLDAFYGLVERENFISIGSRSIKDPSTTIHEVGHGIGAFHPFEQEIPAQKCSPLVSIMCYPNALDVMVPLGNNSKVATLQTPLDPGPQDHKMMRLVFGPNPDYVPSDREFNATSAIGFSRLSAGDENFANSVKLDTASLPAGVKYAAIDVASAVGTCFDFPCDPEMAAVAGDGTVLVLYRDSVAGGKPEIAGSVVVFGGKTNDVIVDGARIEPVVLRPTPTPTTEASPAPDTAEGSSTNTTLIAVLSAVGAAAVAAVVGIVCYRKARARRGEVAPGSNPNLSPATISTGGGSAQATLLASPSGNAVAV